METPPSRRRGSEGPPDALVVDILLRIPVKSIFRFKSVSEEWHRLISDPSFTVVCMSRHPQVFAGFLADPYIEPEPSTTIFIPCNTLQRQPVVPPHLPPANSCYGSSNGLLLVFDNDAFSLLNPINGDSIQIPPEPAFEIHYEPYNFRFDRIYGFICNLGLNGVASYKIFIFSSPASSPTNGVLRVDTFSSDSSEWGLSYANLPRPVRFTHEGVKTMSASDGIVYLMDDDLLRGDYGSMQWSRGDGTIVAYDSIMGTTELITMPLGDHDEDYFSYPICQYYDDGSLGVCRKSEWHFQIWALSGAAGDRTWSLKHKFGIGISSVHQSIHVLYLCKEDRAVYLKLESKIVRCYYENEKWRSEDVCTFESTCEPGIDIHPFLIPDWPVTLPAVNGKLPERITP